MPVIANGRTVGAVQAIQGNGEHDQTVQLLWIAIAGAAGLGLLLAAPAGLFLARRAMRPIDQAFEQQQAFVADAAHELRTPLTVLRANAEMIERLPDIDREELSAELAGMVTEIDDMSRLVSDLLDLARADAGRLVIERAAMDVASVIRETVESMRPLAAAAGLSLSVDAIAPAVAEIDPGRIRQLARVLVDNALSYTGAGGNVAVTVKRLGREVVIEVADTGIGIPEDEQANVFRRFYRTDHARVRAEGGTGLGLSIAFAIAEAHAGNIRLSSTPGKGTLVRVAIPASTESLQSEFETNGAANRPSLKPASRR
jgi:signal transduction histidine kinase